MFDADFMKAKFRAIPTASRVRLSTLIAGICIGIGYPFPFLWPLVFVGIALFLYALQNARSLREALLSGAYAGGMANLLIGIPVFVGVLPLDWFGITSFPVAVAAVTLLLVLYATLFTLLVFVFFAYAAYALMTRTWFDVLLFPALFVIAEFLQSAFFYLSQWGIGSYPGFHYTFGSIGYLLAGDAVLLRLAPLGGIYALCFFIVFASLIFMRALQNGRSLYRDMAIAIIGVFLISHVVFAMKATIHQIDTEKDPISIGVVSRYLPPTRVQSLAFQKMQNEQLTSLLSPLSGITLLVLPENAAYLRQLSDEQESAVVKTMLRKIGEGNAMPLTIDSSDERQANGHIREVATAYRGDQDMSFTQKQLLLPFGEYIPASVQPLISALAGKQFSEQLTAVRGHQPGFMRIITQLPPLKLGIRFCDEVMSPELYRTEVKDGANLLVNVSSLSWFHGSRMIYSYALRMAQVRASETGRYYIQSGNMAPAFVLDDHGSLIAETPWDTPQAVQAFVHLRTGMTPYDNYGSIGVLVSMFLIVFLRIAFYVRAMHRPD